jgi:hypothetical protein
MSSLPSPSKSERVGPAPVTGVTGRSTRWYCRMTPSRVIVVNTSAACAGTAVTTAPPPNTVARTVTAASRRM